MKRILSLLFPALLLLVALPLSADDCLDQIGDQSSGTSQVFMQLPAGQEFVPARRMPLERFEYRMDDFNPGAPYTPLVLTLHYGTLDGPVVPGGVVSTLPEAGIHYEWVPFVFDEPLQLVAGATYVAELWTDTYRWGFRDGGGDTYPHGGSYSYGILSSGDFCFRTFHVCTVNSQLNCVPGSGTLPFTVNIAVGLTNTYSGFTRRLAGNFGIRIAAGTWFGNLRSGFTNLGPGDTFSTSWNQSIPALVSLVGINEFRLLSKDVTPAPYNQPPHPFSGDTDVVACTVEGIAP